MSIPLKLIVARNPFVVPRSRIWILVFARMRPIRASGYTPPFDSAQDELADRTWAQGGAMPVSRSTDCDARSGPAMTFHDCV